MIQMSASSGRVRKKIRKLLEKYASGINLGVLFGLILVVNLLLFPLFMPSAEGLKPLDVRFCYTPDDAYDMIGAYGDNTRDRYIKGIIILDFIYPVIYTFFLGFTLFLLYRKTAPSLIPLLILAFDYIENTGIIILLSTYPDRITLVAWVTSIFTSLKWILVLLVLAAIMAGVLGKFLLKFH